MSLAHRVSEAAKDFSTALRKTGEYLTPRKEYHPLDTFYYNKLTNQTDRVREVAGDVVAGVKNPASRPILYGAAVGTTAGIIIGNALDTPEWVLIGGLTGLLYGVVPLHNNQPEQFDDQYVELYDDDLPILNDEKVVGLWQDPDFIHPTPIVHSRDAWIVMDGVYGSTDSFH